MLIWRGGGFSLFKISTSQLLQQRISKVNKIPDLLTELSEKLNFRLPLMFYNFISK